MAFDELMPKTGVISDQPLLLQTFAKPCGPELMVAAAVTILVIFVITALARGG
jgi:hypothetical protein